MNSATRILAIAFLALVAIPAPRARATDKVIPSGVIKRFRVVGLAAAGVEAIPADWTVTVSSSNPAVLMINPEVGPDRIVDVTGIGPAGQPDFTIHAEGRSPRDQLVRTVTISVGISGPVVSTPALPTPLPTPAPVDPPAIVIQWLPDAS